MAYFYKNEPPKEEIKSFGFHLEISKKAVDNKPRYADTAYAIMLLSIKQVGLNADLQKL
jgi:hypothetical protein